MRLRFLLLPLLTLTLTGCSDNPAETCTLPDGTKVNTHYSEVRFNDGYFAITADDGRFYEGHGPVTCVPR